MPISASASMAAPPLKPWEQAVRQSEFGIVPLVLEGVRQRYHPEDEATNEELFSRVIDVAIRQLVDGWAETVGGDDPVFVVPLKSSTWKTLSEGRDRSGILRNVPDFYRVVLVNRDNGKLHCVRNLNAATPPIIDIELRDALYGQANANEFNRPTRVRASSVDGCQRATFFDISRFPAVDVGEDNPHWRVSAAIGTAIHNLLEDVLDTMPLQTETEYTVELPGVFGGKVDGKVFINGEWVLLDWKTVGAADFRQGAELRKIEKYFAQLSSYAAVEGIKKAVVILVNRDNGKMDELELVLDPKYGKALIKRAGQTMKLVANREVPPADKLGSSDCRFCKFQRQCGEQEDSGYIQSQLDAGGNPERL